MQDVAAAAGAEPGVVAPSALARLGGTGRHRGNVDRDLARMMRRASPFGLQPVEVLIPIRRRAHQGYIMKPWPVLLPHEFLAALHKSGHMDALLGPPGSIPMFWEGVAQEEWCRRHPVHNEPLETAIPVRLHGDEGQGNKKAPVMIISWGSALVHGPSMQTRLLFTVMPAKAYVRRRGRNLTLEALYAILVWSCQALFTGKWPERAPDSWPGWVPKETGSLASGYRCVFVGLKGDAKFIKEAMLWKLYWRACFVCFECFASRTDPLLNYLQLQDDAAWRFTGESHEHYLHNTPPNCRSPLLGIPGFRKDLVCYNLLHVVCLGIGQDFAGAAIVDLVKAGVFGDHGRELDGDALDPALHECVLQFRHWCVAERVGAPSFDTLTAGSLGLPEYPSLPGKAADCRKMLAWLPFVTSAHCMGKGQRETTLAACAWSMAMFWHVCGVAGMFLSEEQAERPTIAAWGIYARTFGWPMTRCPPTGEHIRSVPNTTVSTMCCSD